MTMAIMRVESRKVQKVGTSTLSVSLPKEWVQRTNLEKGDVILFEDLNDGSLRISPPGGQKRRSDSTWLVNADLAQDRGILARIVVGNYVIGRNRIIIKSKTRIRSEHLREVRESVSKLVGMAIMSETSDTIELQCSIDASQFPYDTVIKRLYTIGATMQKEAVEALVKRDRGIALDARSREDEADKQYWLSLRLLLTAQLDPGLAQTIGLHDQLPIVGNRLICKNLEHIADYADNLARGVVDILDADQHLEEATVQRIQRASKLAGSIVQDALSCIFQHDLHLANKAVETAEEVERLEDEILSDILRQHDNPTLVANVRSMVWSIRRIAEYGAEIAVIGINRFLERESSVCREIPQGQTPKLK